MKRPLLLITLPQRFQRYFGKHYMSSRGGTILTASDPKEGHVGSGGGLIHALRSSGVEYNQNIFVINAGGESRRLPAYAAYGKVMLPVPPMPWQRGERIDATLLDLQREMLQRIEWALPKGQSYVVVSSGDVLVTLPEVLPEIPEADIVCLGLWGTVEMARKHGVFVCDRDDPTRLAYMLQKPDDDQLEQSGSDHSLLIDSGIWILNQKALRLLAQKVDASDDGFYDMYSDLGALLGYERESTQLLGEELTAAVWSIKESEFFHFGATADLVRSAYNLQKLKSSAAKTNSYQWKKHPSITILNSVVECDVCEDNQDIWIENSFIPSSWRLARRNMLTGLVKNDANIALPEGTCIDLSFVEEGKRLLRLYNFEDTFKGDWYQSKELHFLHRSATAFYESKGIEYPHEDDVYQLPLFPVVENNDDWVSFIEDYLAGRTIDTDKVFRYVSPCEATKIEDIDALEDQRARLRQTSLQAMAKDYYKTGYYYNDLYVTSLIDEAPCDTISAPNDPEIEMHRAMLAMLKQKRNGQAYNDDLDEAYKALMRLVSTLQYELPKELKTSVHDDQIVMAKCPVRIDIAGGWTDTPPYCHYEGGHVVNLALNINGQDALQVFIKRNKEKYIHVRSIDMGCDEKITTLDDLLSINKSGGPFSIPKVAMLLCGLGEVCRRATSWNSFIDEIGGGFEITMLSTLPAGSGLGVSSILAATTLGALNKYFDLGWSLNEIGARTLVLEQYQGSCGGWQDQFGGIYHGVKSLRTQSGGDQVPVVQWLPDHLFVRPEYRPCHILLYTGITRRAKSVLGSIVERMMANHHDTITLLDEMKRHAGKMADAILHNDYDRYVELIAQSWEYNKQLNPYSTTPEIDHICEMVSDYTLVVKAPGAGGGGFLYMAAKDPDAAARIRLLLQDRANELPPTARLVDMDLASNGLNITLS